MIQTMRCGTLFDRSSANWYRAVIKGPITREGAAEALAEQLRGREDGTSSLHRPTFLRKLHRPTVAVDATRV